MPTIARMSFDINGRTSGLYQLPCDGTTSVTATATFILEWSAAEVAAGATRQLQIILVEPGALGDTEVISVTQPTAVTDPPIPGPIIGASNPGLATSVYCSYTNVFTIRCSVQCQLVGIDAAGRIGVHGDNDAEFTFKIPAPFPGPYYCKQRVSVECTTATTGVFYIPASAITDSAQDAEDEMRQTIAQYPQEYFALTRDQQAFKNALLLEMSELLQYRLAIYKSEILQDLSQGLYLEPDPETLEVDTSGGSED